MFFYLLFLQFSIQIQTRLPERKHFLFYFAAAIFISSVLIFCFVLDLFVLNPTASLPLSQNPIQSHPVFVKIQNF